MIYHDLQYYYYSVPVLSTIISIYFVLEHQAMGGIYMFQVNNRNKLMCEIFPKLTIEIPERRWLLMCLFLILNRFHPFSHIVWLFPFLPLIKLMPALVIVYFERCLFEFIFNFSLLWNRFLKAICIVLLNLSLLVNPVNIYLFKVNDSL